MTDDRALVVKVSWDEAHRRSLGWARRWAAYPDDAEDIAQEALLRAWRNHERLRRPERFYGWLARIVRNEAARVAARPRPLPTEDLEIGASADDEAVEVAVQRADIARQISRLAERERLLLRLRYDDDLTQAAIAERLGMPEGTVKVQLHRARGKLERALKTYEPEEISSGWESPL